MEPPRGDLCSSMWVRFVTKKSRAVAERRRRVGDYVSPAEAASDRHRTNIAAALLGLAWEPALEHKAKLHALKMAFRNVWPVLDQLCHRASDPALARSDAALCLAEMTGELSAALAQLMRLEEAATPRANPAGERHGANRLSRAR